MAARQMEEIQRKLSTLNYPRANAPAQSLLFAGMERYALLEWLFFRYDMSSFTTLRFDSIQFSVSLIHFTSCFADCLGTSHLSLSRVFKGTPWIVTKKLPAFNVRALFFVESWGWIWFRLWWKLTWIIHIVLVECYSLSCKWILFLRTNCKMPQRYYSVICGSVSYGLLHLKLYTPEWSLRWIFLSKVWGQAQFATPFVLICISFS